MKEEAYKLIISLQNTRSEQVNDWIKNDQEWHNPLLAFSRRRVKTKSLHNSAH